MKTAISLVTATALFLAALPALGKDAGFLGIRPRINPSSKECVEVEVLASGGPGEKGGLKVGDVLLATNGEAYDCTKLPKGSPLVPHVAAGDRVVFSILREGKTLEVTVVAAPIPAAMAEAQEESRRRNIGEALYQRLVKTGEVFSIVRLPNDTFKVSGQFSDEESEILAWYWATAGTLRIFEDLAVNEKMDLQIRFDREKGARRFERAPSSAKP